MNAVNSPPAHKFSAPDELTIAEAAEHLNVSQACLGRLLHQGHIPHHQVANHRRVMLADLTAYKQADDAKRATAVDQLTAEAQRLGLDY